jgi:phosphoribosyl 1,2-cyclic phosphodiesterase
MRLHSLGSGSSGNSFLVSTATTAVLIDAGVAIRACQTAVRQLLNGRALDAIVISHEHIDHVRALGSLTRHAALPVVTTEGTRRAIGQERGWTRAVAGGRFAIGDIEIEFVSVSHDAAEPCGFVICHGGARTAIFTDLGHAGPQVLEAVASADAVVLEANYDSAMLRYGPYPAHLKRRIQGPAGHLSNDDCATLLAGVVSDRTRAIWLAHLSHTNNTPDVAAGTVRDALRLVERDIPVQPLPRFAITELTVDAQQQLLLSL